MICVMVIFEITVCVMTVTNLIHIIKLNSHKSQLIKVQGKRKRERPSRKEEANLQQGLLEKRTD